MSDVLDALRGYVQLATGLAEVAVARGRDAASALIAQGMDLASQGPEVPGGDTAKAAAAQVQDLAGDVLDQGKQNSEMIAGLVRTEVDRAAGRMGFVREEELAAVRRHVSRLEDQLADLRAHVGPSAAAPAAAEPADVQPAAPASAEAAATEDAPAPKPVKKKVPVVKPAETDAP